jgi:hypothetical protein
MKALALIALVTLAGCPKMEESIAPREACEGVGTSLCERLYACFSDAELAAAGFPSSEAACVTQFEDDQGCRAQTVENACDGNETYHGDHASVCLDQIEGLSCAQLRSSNLDVEKAAPACGTVCQID